MSGIQAAVGMSGVLEQRVIKSPRPHKGRRLRIPKLGQLIMTRDPGEGGFWGSHYFSTHLQATHRNPAGEIVENYDLGSGLVTNIGVFSMANDLAWLWTGGAGTGPSTLGAQNFQAWGTGATAAAATDFRIQTLAAPTTTTAVTAVQSLVAPVTFVGPTSPIFKSVATITAGSTLTITEWGLFSQATLSSATGSPFTATSTGPPSTWTDTGSAQTASSSTVRGLQQTVVLPGTTTVMGLNGSNTTHVGTLLSSSTTGWYTQATQANGSTPGATEAFTILPVMWDHKQFTGIGVNNLDSIQFTYSLSINSGG